MKEQLKPSASLHLRLPAAAAGRFAPLLGSGVGILTQTGIPLMTLLCDQLGIDRGYVDQRIQTVFVNGRAVDQLDEVILGANAVVALSAAMPGLVGATFRRQGLLAGFRKDITHDPRANLAGTAQETVVLLKLFNLVAKELSLLLLQNGFWAKGRQLYGLMSQLAGGEAPEAGEIRWDGVPHTPEELLRLQWPGDWVAFDVAFSDPP